MVLLLLLHPLPATSASVHEPRRIRPAQPSTSAGIPRNAPISGNTCEAFFRIRKPRAEPRSIGIRSSIHRVSRLPPASCLPPDVPRCSFEPSLVLEIDSYLSATVA